MGLCDGIREGGDVEVNGCYLPAKALLDFDIIVVSKAEDFARDIDL